MPRLSSDEKRHVHTVIMDELKRARAAARDQIRTRVVEVTAQLTEELTDQASRRKEMEALTTRRTAIEAQINVLHQELRDIVAAHETLMNTQLGDWGLRPTDDQVAMLRASSPNDVYNNHRNEYDVHGTWNGVPVRTRLDAAACIQVNAATTALPTKIIDDISGSIETAFAFLATMEDAQRLYADFRKLGLERFGVQLTKQLDHIGAELNALANGQVAALPSAPDDSGDSDKEIVPMPPATEVAILDAAYKILKPRDGDGLHVSRIAMAIDVDTVRVSRALGRAVRSGDPRFVRPQYGMYASKD